MNSPALPVRSETASTLTLEPVIWAVLHALIEPDHYAITYRRRGLTPEISIKPLSECTKVKG
jgi:hypothetical protein